MRTFIEFLQTEHPEVLDEKKVPVEPKHKDSDEENRFKRGKLRKKDKM